MRAWGGDADGRRCVAIGRRGVAVWTKMAAAMEALRLRRLEMEARVDASVLATDTAEMEAELADVNEQLGEKLDALYEFDPDHALARAGIGGVHITKGSPHIGEPVTRVFKKRKFEAVVKSWIPPGVAADDTALYRVKHEDGDEEELDEKELAAAVREFAKQPPRRKSERVLLLEAMALSAAEVDPRTAEALYRPFGEMESVLERTRTLTSESDVAIAGVAREGPFTRYEDEVSPERKLAELGTKGEVWRVPEMRVGDERRVRIVAEGTSPGDGGETDADAAEAKAGTAETDTAKAEADTIYIVAGVPNRARNGAPTAPRLNQRAVAKMAEDFEKVRRHTDSKWHEQGWRGSTNDPFRHDHKSSQFGWSTMAGGAEKQEEARLEGKPFKLNAWEIPQGRQFYENHLAPRLPGWFQCVEDRFPALSKEMRRRVPQEYWLAGTPFTKVTVAINNATPVHFDQKNFGLTCASPQPQPPISCPLRSARCLTPALPAE